QHRFQREKLIGLQQVQLLRIQILVAEGLFLLQQREAFLEDGQLFFRQIVIRASDLFVNLLKASFDDRHVGQNELGLERRDVAQRISIMPEEADHLNQRVVVLHGGEKAGGELRRA